jgi:hypothetical protein
VLFELSGDSDGWIAVAFSKDKSMVSASAVKFLSKESLPYVFQG